MSLDKNRAKRPKNYNNPRKPRWAITTLRLTGVQIAVDLATNER